MRILFSTPYYVPELKFGGPPRKIHSLAAGLAARGHAVSVLTFNSEAPRSVECRSIDGVTVQELRWWGRGLRQMPRDRDVIDQALGNADILQCFGLFNLLSPTVAAAAYRGRVPFVLEPLGMYPPRAGNLLMKHAYNAVITRWLTRRAAAVIAASEAEARDLATIVDERKILYRRNGIDVGGFAKISPENSLRPRWGITDGEALVLYVGRISPVKNLEQLVMAFASANLPNVRLVMVGPLSESRYEKRLRSLITAHRLESTVSLPGPLYGDEQKAALASADLFVLPSINESFGNAAAEAVAADVPVLLTDTCGIAPLIHRRAGLAVPLGIDSLAEGMKALMDPQIRAEVTAHTMEVKRELSWDEPIAETIRLYETIIRGLNPQPATTSAR
ncbi:MAG TPA: glycosyltransferase [Chthoniobacterales bacterium]|nr:glycosyltransferase [Chthoniobacterales bacterium]